MLVMPIMAGLMVAGSPAVGAAAGDPGTLAEVVVKIDLADGHSINELTAAYPVEVDSAVLASRGVYLVRSTDPRYRDDPHRTDELAHKLEDSPAVIYAEPNLVASLADTRFHAWPDGNPDDAGTDPAVWSGQPAAADLGLRDAHLISGGAGTTVAVLDTGVDPTHPALAGRVGPGWDYVDDDSQPGDVADVTDSNGNGIVDEAYGHGTFVSGVIALVAPSARILPYRVLDSDGRGNIFAVAEAIADATAAGADVINLSFGTARKLSSHLIDDSIKAARAQGVTIVAAAGNDGDDKRHFPAAQGETLSVSALSTEDDRLAWFADFGDWVDVAAPGQRIAGPVPGARYAWWAGTSVATPFVAGQAALIKSIAPGIRADKVDEAIGRTARKLRQGRLHSGAIDIPASLTFVARHTH
jgi:subtilisin family serine protease